MTQANLIALPILEKRKSDTFNGYRSGVQSVGRKIRISDALIVLYYSVKLKQTMQYSVASEVKQMVGQFDDEINYKSYSNLTFPVIYSDGDEMRRSVKYNKSI